MSDKIFIAIVITVALALFFIAGILLVVPLTGAI